MNKNKKVLSLVVFLCLIVCSIFNVNASSQIISSRIDAVRANAIAFLADIGVNTSVDSFALMKNFSGQTEAIYFSLMDGGYIVASYKDGHVIEYSPEEFSELLEVIDTQSIYYGGPNLFCVKNGMMLYDLLNKVSFIPSDDFYSVNYIDSIAKYENQRKNSLESGESVIQQTRDALLSPPINYVSASNGWFCTITAIANILQYYDDFYNSDVYSGSVSTVSGLRSALNTNDYVLNSDLWLSDAVDLHCEDVYKCYSACNCYAHCNCTTSCSCAMLYAGLNDYFERSDVSYHIAIVSSAIYSEIKQLLDESYPILLTINSSSLDATLTSLHTVFCYGYWETSLEAYYIVNDGWGHNSVYVCAEDVSSTQEIMFLV